MRKMIMSDEPVSSYLGVNMFTAIEYGGGEIPSNMSVVAVLTPIEWKRLNRKEEGE